MTLDVKELKERYGYEPIPKNEETISKAVNRFISVYDLFKLIEQAEHVMQMKLSLAEEKTKSRNYRVALERIYASAIPLDIDDAVRIAEYALKKGDKYE